MPKRSVSVRILGHEYRVRTDADPASLARVAAFVDETMERVRAHTGAVDSLDLAIMTALNLARDLVTERAQRQGGSTSARRLEELAVQIESALDGRRAPAG